MRTISEIIRSNLIFKTIVLLFTITFFVTVGTPALFSQETTNNESQMQSTFFKKLSSVLMENGWSKNEVINFIKEAKKLNWKNSVEADPEIVAIGLKLANKEKNNLELKEQAQIALGIALTAVEMEKLGFSYRETTRAALNGVRNMLTEINNWKRKGEKGNLGLMIRNQVREQIRSATMAQIHNHARKREKVQGKCASENGFSYIPQNASPWNESHAGSSHSNK